MKKRSLKHKVSLGLRRLSQIVGHLLLSVCLHTQMDVLVMRVMELISQHLMHSTYCKSALPAHN